MSIAEYVECHFEENVLMITFYMPNRWWHKLPFVKYSSTSEYGILWNNVLEFSITYKFGEWCLVTTEQIASKTDEETEIIHKTQEMYSLPEADWFLMEKIEAAIWENVFFTTNTNKER